MVDRIYYRINPDSPIMAVVDSARAEEHAFLQSILSFKAEIGAESVWIDGRRRACGATFPGGDLPPGWRANAKYAVPDKRNRIGKELHQKLLSLPMGVDFWTFSGMLNRAFLSESESDLGYIHWDAGRVLFTTFAKFGDVYVLSVPLGCKVRPAGCDELRMSEYWALVEAARAAEKRTIEPQEEATPCRP